MNYGIIIWGGTYKYLLSPIMIQQKKAIRIISNKPYNYPTENLFRSLKILTFENLYKLNLCKFIYKIKKELVPEVLKNVFVMNYDIHKYNTRNSDCPHLFGNRNSFNDSFFVKSAKLWLKIPINIRQSKILANFNNKLKKHLYE